MVKLKLLLLPIVVSLLASTVSFAAEPSGPDGEVRLEVLKAKLIEKGSFLDVQFRVRGGLGNPNLFMRYARSAFVVEESTGARFSVWRFGRIGTLGQKRFEEGPILFVRIDNSGGNIKKNSLVTLGIGGLRQEHIIVEE